MVHRIVIATADDIQTLVRLNGIVQAFHAETFPALFKANPESDDVAAYFRKALATGRFEAPLCLAEGASGQDQALGFALFEYQDLAESPFTRPFRQGFVHQIAVDPVARRRGVGQALMSHIRTQLAARGIDKIAADVFQANDRARAFFAGEGLTVMREKLEGPA